MLTLLILLLIIAACALVVSFIILDTAAGTDETWVGFILMVGGWGLIALVIIIGKIFL